MNTLYEDVPSQCSVRYLHASFLTPFLDLFGQLLPLVANTLHHGLNLLVVLVWSLLMAVLGFPVLSHGRDNPWGKVSFVDGNHEVHHRRELVGEPLPF